jgi:hypothetical protein
MARLPPSRFLANGLRRIAALLAGCFEGPIRVGPLIFPWQSQPNKDRHGNDGTLKAISRRHRPLVSVANQVPREQFVCAYIGQSACQATAGRKAVAFA